MCSWKETQIDGQSDWGCSDLSRGCSLKKVLSFYFKAPRPSPHGILVLSYSLSELIGMQWRKEGGRVGEGKTKERRGDEREGETLALLTVSRPCGKKRWVAGSLASENENEVPGLLTTLLSCSVTHEVVGAQKAEPTPNSCSHQESPSLTLMQMAPV